MSTYRSFVGIVLLLWGCNNTPPPEAIPPVLPPNVVATPPPTPTAAIANFNNSEGRFQVYFPGTPQRVTQQTQADIGTIALVQYCYQATPYQLWAVSYADYPEALLRLGTPQRLLEGVYQRLLSQLHARPAGEPQWEERPDRTLLRFSAALPRQQGQTHYCLLLDQRRLYQISLQTAGGPISEQDSLDLFGSFGVLE